VLKRAHTPMFPSTETAPQISPLLPAKRACMGATFSTPCARVRRVCCYPTPRQLTRDWSELVPVAVWIGQLGMWAEKRRETALSPSSLLSPNTPRKQDDVPAEITQDFR